MISVTMAIGPGSVVDGWPGSQTNSPWDCQRFDTRGAFFMPEADQGSALLEETWRQRVGLGDRSQAVGGDPGQPPIADHDLGEGLVLRIRFEEVRCIHERIGFDERPQLAPVLAGT
jgi:hypothetical protein